MDHELLWKDAVILPQWRQQALHMAERLILNKDRYKQVVEDTEIPWWVVGVIHAMESNCNFNTHLHNGDSLLTKTVRVPAGRPKNWYQLPKEKRTWEASAKDAVACGELEKKNWARAKTALLALEAFNGMGYNRVGIKINSPYLWSGTQFYTTGKFYADRKFSFSVVSKQLGCVPLMKQIGVVLK